MKFAAASTVRLTKRLTDIYRQQRAVPTIIACSASSFSVRNMNKFQRSEYDRVDFSEYMCYNILKATFVGCCSQLYQKSNHRKDSF